VQIVRPGNRNEKFDISQALQPYNIITALDSACYERHSGERKALGNLGVGD
jgi:hypothetical protein